MGGDPAFGKLLFAATWRVRRARATPEGMEAVRNPAFSNCQAYSLPFQHELYVVLLATSMQPGPGMLLPFTTKNRRPSALRLIDSGYQPVGTSPTTWLGPRSSSPSRSPSSLSLPSLPW